MANESKIIKSPSHIYSGPCPFCGEVIDIEFFYREEIFLWRTWKDKYRRSRV
jgi:hypothetical protein